MPVDFDICAISNTLLALSVFGLPPRRAEEESVGFIESAVTRGEHVEKPFQTAPWYGTTPVILYHLARVIARTDIGPLKSLTDRLLVDVRSVFSSRALREMEKLLLSTAAMWLGGGPLLTHAPRQIAGELSSYPFFVASLLAVPENYFARSLAHRRLFHFEYVCPAHSMALWVEHEVLRRRTVEA